MNPNYDLQERASELLFLAQQQDLNLATRRLMDFITDFELTKELREEAVMIRIDYNKSLLKDDSEQEQQKTPIINRILVWVQKVQQNTHSKKGNASEAFINYDQLKEEFLRSRYFMYEPKDTEIAFDGSKLGKEYPSVGFSLQNISLQLKLGELTGIVGENGNGKTTLLRIIAGDLGIYSGIIRYPAFNVPQEAWYLVKQNIAFIPQNLANWKGLLKDNLHFSAANHGIFGSENEELVDFVIHRLGLTRYQYATWNEISNGYKLRFELAKSLVWRPKLLILDEPLANLDINAKLLFMQDLRLLANSTRHPISIVMSSQQLHEIESVVDNIVFIKEGKAIYNGKVAQIGEDRQQNSFELAGNFERAELYYILKELGQISIDDTGQSLVVHVPRNIESSQVLNKIAAVKKIDYFRDISRSTRKLF